MHPPSYFKVHGAASAIDFHIPSDDMYDDMYVASTYDSEEELLEEDQGTYNWIACGYQASVQAADPSIEELGDSSNLNNYLPDSGATQHMTPRRENLYNAVEGQKLGVEVANGHVIRCTTTGKVRISMTDDNGKPLSVELHGCMYVPGLSRRLFLITKFASNGHRASITKDAVTLFFGSQECPVTIPLRNGINIASNVRTVWRQLAPGNNRRLEPRLIPERAIHQRGANHIKYVNLSLIHDWLGHRALSTILAADEHKLWNDVRIRIEPESDCMTCKIATIRATARNTHPHTKSHHPGETVFLDILPCKSRPGLTTQSSHAYCLILVDAFFCFSVLYGLPNKSTDSVVAAILDHGST